MNDLEGACTSTTCLRKNIIKTTWLVAVVARCILSSSVPSREQRWIFFGASLPLLCKYVNHEKIWVASPSSAVIFMSGFLVSTDATFCADRYIYNRCNGDGIFIPIYVFLIPQLIKKEIVPIFIRTKQEKQLPSSGQFALVVISRWIGFHSWWDDRFLGCFPHKWSPWYLRGYQNAACMSCQV